MIRKIKITQQNYETLFLGFILLIALLFYAIFIFYTSFIIKSETYFTLVDDAMISMRYARNLSDGFGLVWNIGESPVEGFTNLGWTLYMALIHKFPVPESKISLLVMITSSLLLLGNIYLSFKITKILDPALGIAPLIAAIITAFYYPVIFWSLRGMEVSLTIFLVYLAVLLVLNPSRPINTKRALLLGVILFSAIFVRFDMILQVTIVLAYCLYNQIKLKAGFRSILLTILLYLAGVIGILLFQYDYFGSVFPNTYYLKVVGISLFERLFVGIQVFVEYATRDFLTLLFIIVPGFIVFRDLRNKRYFLLLALFLIQCFYSIYIGGDYAEPLNSPQVSAANRFIIQGMLSVIILFSIVIDRFSQILDIGNRTIRSSAIIIFGVGLASVVIISGANWFKWTIHNAPLLDADIWRTRLGIHIRDYTDKNALIAVHAAGQIPYYSNRKTVDLLGKSDPVVAKGPPATSFRPGHNKWNYEYSILTLRPDLIADEWGQLNAFLSNESDYDQLQNRIWVHTDSTYIDIEGLQQQYR
jgi:hypothetical protein